MRSTPRRRSSPASPSTCAWTPPKTVATETVGATLALVGAVGTAGPITVPIFQNVGTELSGGAQGDAGARETGQAEAFSSGGAAPAAEGESGNDIDNGEDSTDGGSVDEMTTRDLPAERSPWPMVLFTGVALMIAVGLLRWILVPRAG